MRVGQRSRMPRDPLPRTAAPRVEWARMPARRVLYGISLVCFANLLLEVVLTRIFSATMYYHFTFLAISLALLGMGASGVWVYVRAQRLAGGAEGEGIDIEPLLARWARIFAVSTVVALA